MYVCGYVCIFVSALLKKDLEQRPKMRYNDRCGIGLGFKRQMVQIRYLGAEILHQTFTNRYLGALPVYWEQPNEHLRSYHSHLGEIVPIGDVAAEILHHSFTNLHHGAHFVCQECSHEHSLSPGLALGT